MQIFVPGECICLCKSKYAGSPTVPGGYSCGLTLTANYYYNLTFDWYDALAGGALLKSGTSIYDRSFTAPDISTSTTYYVQSRNLYTGCVSARVPVLATTSPAVTVAAPTVSDNVSLTCPGTVTLSATPPSGAVVDWYGSTTGYAPLATASNSHTRRVSSSGTFYAQARIGGCVSSRVAVGVTVINEDVINEDDSFLPDVYGTSGSATGCNSNVTLSAYSSTSGAEFDWYDAETGGAKLYTGASYTTPAINTATTYYVEARIPNTNCVSSSRVAVEAQLPDVPAFSAISRSRCGSGTVSLSVSSSSSITADWYQYATGGLILPGGAATTTFVTPSLSTSTTYYALVKNTASGCVAVSRTPVLARIYAGPATITTQPVSLTTCPMVPAALTVVAEGENLSYTWYRNGRNASSSYPIHATGANTANLLVVSDQSASYTVHVYTGTCRVTSNTVTVTIGGNCTCDLASAGTTMQNFNPPACTPVGSTWTLTDTRDGKAYEVLYYADGLYWMNQQLKFGDLCNKTTFDAEMRKDQIGLVNSSGTYYGDCMASTYTGAGYWYSWAAAVNASGAHYGTAYYSGCDGTGAAANACQGICPSGWHVPTRSEGAAVAAIVSNYDEILPALEDLYYWPHSGYLWLVVHYHMSSTYETHDVTSTIGANTNYVYVIEGRDSPYRADVRTDDKENGYTVRCVKNY